MPDFLTLSMCFYRVCERRNLPLKAQKSQIWAGGNAGVKLNFPDFFYSQNNDSEKNGAEWLVIILSGGAQGFKCERDSVRG